MNVKTNTYQVTIPWGPGSKVPPENLVDEVKVRGLFKEYNEATQSHIKMQDTTAIGNGFSSDLDPDPTRILRTRKAGGEEFILEVTTTPVDDKGQQAPKSMVYRAVDKPQLEQLAEWKDGEVVYLYESRHSERGETQTTITVNENGTLTYTRTTPEE